MCIYCYLLLVWGLLPPSENSVAVNDYDDDDYDDHDDYDNDNM
jgi:hypothetical protein